MIEMHNLPFQAQNYFQHPEHLETIRNNVQSLIHHDITSLQQLLTTVQVTLHNGSQQVVSKIDELKRKQNQFRLFQTLSQQNRQRSENISGLAELIVSLLDFIEEKQHQTQDLLEAHQLQIDQLSNKIEQLSFGKDTIANQVQVFRDQLQRARNQIDLLTVQREEEEFQEQMVNEGLNQRDLRIEELEAQLERIKANIQSYKQNTQSKSNLKGITSGKSLRYVRSDSNFFGASFRGNFYRKMNQQLQSQQRQLQKELQKVNSQQNIGFNLNLAQKDEGNQKFLTESSIEEQDMQPSKEGNDKLQADLGRALQHVMSKNSFCSQFSRNSSLPPLHFLKENQKNQLYNDFEQSQQRYDLLPIRGHQLTYLTDCEGSLTDSPSRDRFDFFCGKQMEYATTKESDRQSRKTGYNVPIISPTKYSKVRQSRFAKIKALTRNIYSVAVLKEEEVASVGVKKDRKQGFCSSVFNYIVNNRIKRVSQKANNCCPVFRV